MNVIESLDRKATGPKGYPLIGAMPALRRDPLAFMAETARRFPDVADLGTVMGRDWHLVSNPEGVKHVLQDNHRNYERGLSFKPLAILGSDNLPMLEHESWFARRRMLQPVFHNRQIPVFVQTMVDCTHRSIRRIEAARAKSGVFDLSDELTHLTLDVISETMFGTSCPGEAHEISGAVQVAFDYVNERAMSILSPPLWVPTSANRAFLDAQRILDRIVNDLIRRRRASGEHHEDLLGLLLAARDEDGTMLNDQQVHDEAIAFFMAGQESTAKTLTWTFHLLANQPEVRDTLAAEIQSTLGDRDPSFESLRKLVYTRSVLEEAMRLYPPAWLLSRTPVRDDVVCGARIKRDSVVLISPYGMHRSPVLFDAPERFDPSRFLGPDAATRSRFAYLPFGAGPRVCIGKEFGMMEAVIAVAMIDRSFDFSHMGGNRVVPKAGFTLYPRDPILMKIRKKSARVPSNN